MINIPTRRSLVVQTADILRQEIARGLWRDVLPGQRPLCDLLRVSRTTLEPALAVLQRQGIIRISHGRRTRIVSKRKLAQRSSASMRVVALIHGPIYALSQSTLYTLTQLQHRLQTAGFVLDIRFDARLSSNARDTPKRLAGLVCETPAACWILFSMNHAVQRWFMDRRLPTILFGTAHADVRLPSLDTHNEAVFRHAAGRFLAAGHRRVALLMPRFDLAGDLEGERGFLAVFEAGAYSGAEGLVVHYDGTTEGVRAALGPLLVATPPVTGLLVADPRIVLSVMGHLQASGKSIPRDVSILTTEYDEFLDYHVPSVASYRHALTTFAARLSRQVLTLAETGYLPARATRLMAEFQPGASFGPVVAG